MSQLFLMIMKIERVSLSKGPEEGREGEEKKRKERNVGVGVRGNLIQEFPPDSLHHKLMRVQTTCNTLMKQIRQDCSKSQMYTRRQKFLNSNPICEQQAAPLWPGLALGGSLPL